MGLAVIFKATNRATQSRKRLRAWPDNAIENSYSTFVLTVLAEKRLIFTDMG